MAEVKKKKKGNTTVKVVVAGTILLGGIGIGILLYRQNKKKAEFPELPDTNVKPSSTSSSTTVKSNTKSSTPQPTTTTVVKSGPTLTAAMAAKIAEEIRRATYIQVKDDYGKNWPFLVQAISLLKNVDDYKLVNAEYQKIGFVAKTIVTHLLTTYGQYNAYRQRLVTEFQRMGLKQSADGKWSLSGLGKPSGGNVLGRRVATTAPIVAVRAFDNSMYQIGAGDYVGEEITRRDEISTVLNADNSVIYVPSTTLQYV